MTEDDGVLHLPWRRDPESHGGNEGGDVSPWILDQKQHVNGTADLFVFELDGEPIGEGSIQAMNLDRILGAFPGSNCQRIDLQLALSWWARGVGSRAIRLLTSHAFATGADLVWAVGVRSDDEQRRNAFTANGYVNWRRVSAPDRPESAYCWDLVCRREHFEGRAAVQKHPGPDEIRAGDEPFGATVVVYRRRPALELLVLHRASHDVGEWGDWAWTPPAGCRFPAELPDDCAARELHEEVGIEARPSRMVGVGGSQWWMYSLEVDPGFEVKLDEEHDRFEWVPAAEAVRRCLPDFVSADIATAAEVLTR